MRKGLWGIIDLEGDSTSASSMQDKHKALGIIAEDLSNEVIHHISDVKDAKQAWDQLNKIFGTDTKHSKINLLMQFYRFDKDEADSMAHHINKFKALKQQLAGIKKVIPEDEAIAVLLNSVDKAPYDNLVSTLKNLDKTLEEIESALLEHESKHKPMHTSTSNKEEVALYTRGGFKTRGRGNFTNERGRGRGHGQQGRTLTCNICGKPGHFARDCYYRTEEANFVEEAPSHEEPIDILF